jgi:hypothetical protein
MCSLDGIILAFLDLTIPYAGFIIIGESGAAGGGRSPSGGWVAATFNENGPGIGTRQ